MTALSASEAAEFLHLEAHLLDRGEFDAWLDLYLPDAVFWMPAWRDDGSQTEDPDSELSLIYYQGRRNLEDRIRRIRSGQSIASKGRPRTVHLIGNVMVSGNDADAGQIDVASNFNVQLFDTRAERMHCFFGHYEHQLVPIGGEWKISRKLIRLVNDVVPTLLDVYCV